MLSVKKFLTTSVMISSFLFGFSSAQAMDPAEQCSGKLKVHSHKLTKEEYCRVTPEGEIQAVFRPRTLIELTKTTLHQMFAVLPDNIIVKCGLLTPYFSFDPSELDILLEGKIDQGLLLFKTPTTDITWCLGFKFAPKFDYEDN